MNVVSSALWLRILRILIFKSVPGCSRSLIVLRVILYSELWFYWLLPLAFDFLLCFGTWVSKLIWKPFVFFFCFSFSLLTSLSFAHVSLLCTSLQAAPGLPKVSQRFSGFICHANTVSFKDPVISQVTWLSHWLIYSWSSYSFVSYRPAGVINCPRQQWAVSFKNWGTYNEIQILSI